MSSVIAIESPKIDIRNLNFYYNKSLEPALENINMPIPDKRVTALIGPSGCGKTTLLRCLNRMHDLYPGIKYEGEIIFDNTNILSKSTDLIVLRSRIGMVFQKPTPFPMSIFENVAFGLRLMGINNKTELKDRVEAAIKMAALWDEVGNRLNENAFSLSGGQQQRLVIARAIAVNP
ncbi:MAG TPA: ATP-binding cassette domain-containing protein, partial [Hydrogenobaculum sp.]|nr:ATP-binding cassette domain-containing protein [Hydrogenobaculum sp.]